MCRRVSKARGDTWLQNGQKTTTTTKCPNLSRDPIFPVFPSKKRKKKVKLRPFSFLGLPFRSPRSSRAKVLTWKPLEMDHKIFPTATETTFVSLQAGALDNAYLLGSRTTGSPLGMQGVDEER
ncbi:hypothetical protein RvY_05575-2 [Ramazzottius varieornatus]|uniref:Uncharacterized protein n=1 Tax=Ramazzottius varieornatus TaxID=947166 RepID=A0A1D1UZ48_RAMVA|nr:hypothetical protein RvY_05575-2 [Ramazzottius varieornatus]